MDAWNTMKRARDLLTMASCYAAKCVDKGDSCRDLAEQFVTLLDIIENEVDDAMMKIPRDPKAKPADDRPAA